MRKLKSFFSYSIAEEIMPDLSRFKSRTPEAKFALILNTGETLSISDISMGAKDCYQIHHKYSAYAICRAYVPFGDIKRFSLFADVMLGGSLKQGKAFNAGGDYVLGAYEQAYSLELAVNPGIMAFLTNNLALEFNVGLF